MDKSYLQVNITRSVILIVTCVLLSGCRSETGPDAISYSYDNVSTVRTIDDAFLTYRLDRPESLKPVPLLLVIDGSSCRGPEFNGLVKIMVPDAKAPKPFARLIVDKIGVEVAGNGKNCSDEFLQHYSIEDRLLQHLRILQHLRKTAPWWNGDLLIWGWSDGGDIGAQLTAYYPNTKRAVLGAMGGGITMAENFRDEELCSDKTFKTSGEPDVCISDLEKKFYDIRRNPAWDETWFGHDNTLKVWETRLFSRLSHLLIDTEIPLLIVHGEDDRGQIKGARQLREDLQTSGNNLFTYWEVSGMGHSPRTLRERQSTRLYTVMRDWLLVGEVVAPDFVKQFP